MKTPSVDYILYFRGRGKSVTRGLIDLLSSKLCVEGVESSIINKETLNFVEKNIFITLNKW